MTVIHKSTPGARARMVFEVTAGVIPGHALDEHTKRWLITSETWYAEIEQASALPDDVYKAQCDEHGRWTGSSMVRFMREAYEYAQSLTDPRGMNWVRVDWLYF